MREFTKSGLSYTDGHSWSDEVGIIYILSSSPPPVSIGMQEGY